MEIELAMHLERRGRGRRVAVFFLAQGVLLGETADAAPCRDRSCCSLPKPQLRLLAETAVAAPCRVDGVITVCCSLPRPQLRLDCEAAPCRDRSCGSDGDGSHPPGSGVSCQVSGLARKQYR